MMEPAVEAAVIKTAGKWALYLSSLSDNETKLSIDDKRTILEDHYLWAKKFLTKHASGRLI